MPTILELIDEPIPDSVEGKSLVQYCKAFAETMDDVATAYAYMENLPRHWLGVRTSDWKLILTDEPLPNTYAPQTTLGVLKAAVASALGILHTYKECVHPLTYAVIRMAYRCICWIYRLLCSMWSLGSKPQPVPEIEPPALSFERKVLGKGRVFALYNLRNDPDEQHDVAGQHPEIVQALKAQLTDMVAGSVSELDNISEPDRAKIERQLKTLGYF